MSPFRPSRPTVRTAFAALAAAAVLAVVPAATRAHADHGKPQHGGVVAEAGSFQGELVAGPRGTPARRRPSTSWSPWATTG